MYTVFIGTVALHGYYYIFVCVFICMRARMCLLLCTCLHSRTVGLCHYKALMDATFIVWLLMLFYQSLHANGHIFYCVFLCVVGMHQLPLTMSYGHNPPTICFEQHAFGSTSLI